MVDLTPWVTGGALITLIVAVFKTNADNHKRVSRVYQRLDETKSAHDDKYVSKEVCGILHKEIKDDVKEIKVDIKKILHKNGLQ
jgi:hypothetical protein